MRLALVILLGLSLSLVSSFSYSFGATGHRVIAHIADDHLSERARKAVNEILGGESLTIASTWADEMRSSSFKAEFWGYDYAANWHFVNINENLTYAESEKSAQGDAYLALRTFESILKNEAFGENSIKDGLLYYFGTLDGEDNQLQLRQFALRFLIHIVADLHQPLHVGKEADQGGNNISVNWFGRSSNLHTVWDSRLVEFLANDYLEISNKISRKVNLLTSAEMVEIQQASPLDWINEGLILRVQVYDVDRYNSSFADAYALEFSAVIENQMQKAGLRLAAVLNEIFK